MKHHKLFSTHSEYESYIANPNAITPNVSYCDDMCDSHFEKLRHNYANDYFTIEALEDATFQFTNAGLSYSLDNGNTWTALDANTATPTVSAGNKILFKGTMTPTVNNGIGKFSSTGKYNAMGNVMSLLFGNDFVGQTDLTGKDWTFYRLFYNDTHLTDASNLMLPATTLATKCYDGMFFVCTSLTTAPELPATTLANNCYDGMFMECASLVTVPKLPATTLANYCYRSMFNNCASLTTAPELPATTLTSYGYSGMFHGCTSLTTAPELPATTLAYGCYIDMFGGCTSLTTAPTLPATTLSSYCYTNMFNGCTNLNYIKAMFTTAPSSTYTGTWVSGVSSTGTFVKNSVATWDVTGVNGVPSGWTVQTASA